MLSSDERNARILATLKQTMPHVTNFSHDIGLPTKPVGHRSGSMTSTAIIRSYRKDHRRGSQHVEPQVVIEVLEQAHIRRWVLMGLYGYVGYLAMPRATQDVHILVADDEIERVVEAICKRWPALQLTIDKKPFPI